MDKLKELLCAIGGLILILLIVVTIISCIGIYYFSVICKYGFNILTLLPILVIMLIIIAVLE